MAPKRPTDIFINYTFYGGIEISLWILFFYLGQVTGGANLSLFFKIFSALADSTFFLFFLIFLKGKLKYISLFVPFIVSFIIWVNILYFRNFHDLVPASLYLSNQVGDETVVSSIRSSSRLSDIILFIAPFIPVIIALGLNFKDLVQIKLQNSFIISILVVLLASWGITFVGAYRRISIYNATSDVPKVLKGLYPEFTTNWIFFYNQHNFTGYIFRCITKSFGTKKILTQSEIDDIKGSIISKSFRDTTINNIGRRSNLILIVVESLPMKILELENRKSIIPCLDSLVNDSLSILKRTIVIKAPGRSSDAQFIYNTGILPLRDEPLVTNYASKDYPSISKAMGGYSMEIIGEKGSLWSHNITTKSYGYDKLISDIADAKVNQDSIIFDRAISEIKNLHSPFFLFVSTLSMHDPYLDPKVSHELSPIELDRFEDSRDKEYLQRLNHFDKYLGIFLQKLKGQDKYDHTAIVIVGDHDINEESVSEKLYDTAVPLIILNAGISEFKKGDITQLDIFPSILEMLNLNYQFLGVSYSGLGRSIFQDPSDSSMYVPSEADYEISSQLIRGVY